MSHEVLEDMVYSYKIPMWHNITEPCQDENTAVEVLNNKFHGGFLLHLRPVTVELNGEDQETGDLALVRGKTSSDDSKEMIFGYCSERYKPLQPYQIAEVFDLNVKAPVETMAFIFEGKEMFISWKMPGFDVKVGDELQLFGIIKSGFDSLKGTSLFTAIYRPICANTVALAASWADKNTDGKGKGNVWNSKHVNKNLLRDLGYWSNFIVQNAERQSELLQSFFGKLVNKPIKKDEEVHEILFEAFPPVAVPEFIPSELKAEKIEKVETENKRLEDMRDGIASLFFGNGTGITPDYFGVYNSSSEYFCHKLPSKKPVATSVMFGNRQKMMGQVIDVLVSKL
jgi:hypothetical protein